MAASLRNLKYYRYLLLGQSSPSVTKRSKEVLKREDCEPKQHILLLVVREKFCSRKTIHHILISPTSSNPNKHPVAWQGCY